MKKFTIQGIILLIIIFGALALATGKISDVPFIPQRSEVTKLKIGENVLEIEIADNSSKRVKGLGGRQSLASNWGMLFVFQKEGKYPFWMKSMKFPLDFIWINRNTVVDYMKNVPPPQPGQPDQSLPIYSSAQLVDMLLEVNAGYIDSHNIKIGDTVEILRR